MRRLGVDPGDARVGLAVSDADDLLATPLCTVAARGEGDPAKLIAAEAARTGCEEIIVGLPRNLDGSEGGAARKARLLAGRIHAATGLRVVLWDERLTSQAAHRALAGVEMSSRDRRGKVDRVAAVLLLEGYLDAVRARRRRSERLGDATSQSLEDDAEAMWHEPVRTAEDRGVPGRGGRRARGPNRP